MPISLVLASTTSASNPVKHVPFPPAPPPGTYPSFWANMPTLPPSIAAWNPIPYISNPFLSSLIRFLQGLIHTRVKLRLDEMQHAATLQVSDELQHVLAHAFHVPIDASTRNSRSAPNKLDLLRSTLKMLIPLTEWDKHEQQVYTWTAVRIRNLLQHVRPQAEKILVHCAQKAIIKYFSIGADGHDWSRRVATPATLQFPRIDRSNVARTPHLMKRGWSDWIPGWVSNRWSDLRDWLKIWMTHSADGLADAISLEVIHVMPTALHNLGRDAVLIVVDDLIWELARIIQDVLDRYGAKSTWQRMRRWLQERFKPKKSVIPSVVDDSVVRYNKIARSKAMYPLSPWLDPDQHSVIIPDFTTSQSINRILYGAGFDMQKRLVALIDGKIAWIVNGARQGIWDTLRGELRYEMGVFVETETSKPFLRVPTGA